MKKVMLMLVLTALTTVGRAELFDDFQGYDISVSTNVIDLETTWEARESSDLVDIIDDGTGNQVLAFGGVGFQNPAITAIPDTAAATTMFYRFYVANEDVDNSFGLSDLTDNGWFDNFEIQTAVIRSGTLDDGVVDFKARNNGTTTTLTTVNASQWYNVWIVVDQVNDTYDVFLTSGNAAATEADLVADDYGFRNGTSDSLVAIKGLGYGSADHCMYIDDISFSEGKDLSYPPIKPYEPSVERVANGSSVDVTLSWKPSVDPAGVNAVNPAVSEEYVFLGTSKDMQYYIGTLGDPGTEEVISQWQESGLDFDTTYYWTVVDAIEGYEETFEATDTLDDADPNYNIVGNTWAFDSLVSSAVITSQPTDTRVFISDAEAQFVVGYNTAINPVVTATWYKDGVELADGGDISSTFTAEAGAGEAVLTIATPTLADEGAYYCVLSTDAGETSDDVTTATRLLTIKMLLAEYTFDNAVDPLASTGDMTVDAAKVKTILLSDPNSLNTNSVTEVSATTADGIVGNALVLSSDDTIGEYIDLGANSFPRAGELTTVGDIRGEGYWKQGFGRGMDAGSILMWVKLESDGSLISNASNSDGTHFAVTSDGAASARVIVRGDNWGEDSSWQNLGEANGSYSYMTDYSLQDGEWHMIAATWSDSTARIYINGEQVAVNSQGYAEDYTAWQYNNTVGASRQGQPDRHLLNASDFITGAIDELRIYNYPVSAEDIASEYEMLNEVGVTPCMDHNFIGNEANLDNSVDSYCIVDLHDFAQMAANWLASGF